MFFAICKTYVCDSDKVAKSIIPKLPTCKAKKQTTKTNKQITKNKTTTKWKANKLCARRTGHAMREKKKKKIIEKGKFTYRWSHPNFAQKETMYVLKIQQKM